VQKEISLYTHSYREAKFGTFLLCHPVYLPVANYLGCICAKIPKNYENWLAANEVIAKISSLPFLAHPGEMS